MSIINNAIDSIRIGVEDYESSDQSRNISAVRNVLAGILLLYKHKLCLLSPAYDRELLIKKKIRPKLNNDGNIVFVGVGKATLDVNDIKIRFKDFKIHVDWSRFQTLNLLRNNIEHYYSTVPNAVVEEILTKSIVLVTDFIKKELDEDPQDMLGNKCWRSLLHIGEVYENEKKDCLAKLNLIDWKYKSFTENVSNFQCPACLSDLVSVENTSEIFPNINLTCKSCTNTFDFYTYFIFLSDFEYFRRVKNVEDFWAGLCADCGNETYLYSESECFLCGSNDELELHCAHCGTPLTQNIDSNGDLCGYCYDNLSERF